MRVLINALSATGLSGQHVLLGHLPGLARSTRGEQQYVVLHHSGNRLLRRELGERVSWLEAPRCTRSWPQRLLWETTCLNGLLRRQGIDVLFTLSGATVPNCRVPQVSMAMNPWSLVRRIHRSPREQCRAWIQRRAYRQAVRQAASMVYISDHLRGHYQRNAAGARQTGSVIAYSGIDDATLQQAAEFRDRQPRDACEILAVSAMAHWKNIETILLALARLRGRRIAARLTLVGPWPDGAYERFIRGEIGQLGLQDRVEITGQVSKDQLHRHYARARVYCLMSHCESFGIPALEAQAFGTPVVGSDCCALPEICGPGGLFGPAEDVENTADMLERLLTDQATCERLSAAARNNAAQYRWERCSQPLTEMFQGFGL